MCQHAPGFVIMHSRAVGANASCISMWDECAQLRQSTTNPGPTSCHTPSMMDTCSIAGATSAVGVFIPLTQMRAACDVQIGWSM